MKWRIKTGAVVMFLLAAALCSSAADAKPGDGKEFYKGNCKTCHQAGSPSGEYTPMTKTQGQWNKFFDNKFMKSHEGVTDPKSGKKVPELVPPDMLKVIRKFLVDHAADSEQPQTCG